MGLISAATGSISNVVGDQFKEYVTCPTSDSSVLVVRGVVNHGSANTNPTPGVITNGSKIVVPSGYAMMIIDNGAIKEFTAEPGEFIWDSSSEPSIFEGGFFKGIGDSIKKIGSRITYGGQAARDQRVYYVNLLTITGNKYGSSNPQLITDRLYGSVEVTFHGEYSFKVVDPTVLVANLIGANAKDTITVDEVVGGQLKQTFANNVTVCISDLMTKNNISFTDIQSYLNDVRNTMNNLLDDSWRSQYGLEIEDLSLNIVPSEESREIIREISKEKTRGELYSSNPSGLMAAATADTMRNASSNDNGAMMGFMGMNMAQNVGANVMAAASNMTAPNTEVSSSAESQTTSTKYCTNCGKPVSGNFCSSCGTKVE